NSERYLVGPISILELDIPAPADLFGLAGSVRAATAVYRYGEGFTYDVLVVQYPNPSWAQSKYDALVRFFQGTEGFQVYPPDRGIPQPFFVFKDLGTEEFGALKLEGTRLLLYTRVPNAPLFKQLLTTGGNIAITGRMP
ncbi:MAG TPA: hypothetical protein VEI97_13825, partial [bacterium]|nr:hypothetical protein [bacterium]